MGINTLALEKLNAVNHNLAFWRHEVLIQRQECHRTHVDHKMGAKSREVLSTSEVGRVQWSGMCWGISSQVKGTLLHLVPPAIKTHMLTRPCGFGQSIALGHKRLGVGIGLLLMWQKAAHYLKSSSRHDPRPDKNKLLARGRQVIMQLGLDATRCPMCHELGGHSSNPLYEGVVCSRSGLCSPKRKRTLQKNRLNTSRVSGYCLCHLPASWSLQVLSPFWVTLTLKSLPWVLSLMISPFPVTVPPLHFVDLLPLSSQNIVITNYYCTVMCYILMFQKMTDHIYTIMVPSYIIKG